MYNAENFKPCHYELPLSNSNIPVPQEFPPCSHDTAKQDEMGGHREWVQVGKHSNTHH